jgi:hypothetical protein
MQSHNSSLVLLSFALEVFPASRAFLCIIKCMEVYCYDDARYIIIKPSKTNGLTDFHYFGKDFVMLENDVLKDAEIRALRYNMSKLNITEVSDESIVAKLLLILEDG